MKNDFLKTYPVEIKFVSPVHIGTGETIEPYEYFLQESEGNYFLCVIDMPKILRSINPEQRDILLKVIDTADLSKIRKFLQNDLGGNKCATICIQVQSLSYTDIEKGIFESDRSGEIHLMTRNAASGFPYIPGSSIKGAIRTAYIDGVLRNSDIREKFKQEIESGQSNENFAKKLEADAFDNLSGIFSTGSDPFKQFAVSDATLCGGDTYIDKVEIVKQSASRNSPKNRSTIRRIQIFREVVWSQLDSELTTAQFEVRLHAKLHQATSKGVKGVSRAIGIKQVIKYCNDYYLPEMKSQADRFASKESEKAGVQKTLHEVADSIKPNQCVIRIGRHSHYECVTFTEPYNYKPRKGAGSTRSYIGGIYPLGWALLTFPASVAE